MADKRWPALVIKAARIGQDDLISAILDDFSPAAIEDLAWQPLPPGGLWDPTFPPPPEPPPAPAHWRVFFHTPDARASAEAALREQLPDITFDRLEVEDDNWAARSQASLTAVRAGAFVVAPPWDIPVTGGPGSGAADQGVTTIVIEPSRGFGTGHHASTRLCLRALSEVDVEGKRVLDLGTGSGVLAMAAALKGAREVIAVDVDPDAIEAARESAAMNRLPIAVDWLVDDFRDSQAGLKPRHYEIVCANLTAGMLMISADCIQSFLTPGGLIVMSGFDESERTAVRDAFANMHDVASLSEDGWVSLVLRS
jgi:ribosomal protein L11 methyltransferase